MGTVAGVVALSGVPVEPERLRAMAAVSLKKLDQPPQIWFDGAAGMLHGSFATTPEAMGDLQPRVDTTSRLVLCFEGRLDNRPELFRLLPADDRPETGAPDSELVLVCYQRFGEDCVKYFVGDYVLAVWSVADRRLVLLRSPGGWVPLYWCRTNELFCFAAEPAQLLIGAGLRRSPNESMLAEILSRHVVSRTETIWEGICRVRPGWSLTIQDGVIRQARWYTGPFPEVRLTSDGEYAECFRHLLDQALASCFRSNTEVAANLSGGLDSSSIVCRAAELYQAGELGRLVRPMSVVYPGTHTDESDWIAAAIRHTGLEPSIFMNVPYDWEAAPNWSRLSALLPVRPNAVSLANLYEPLRQAGVRVLLTGAGGDEFLAGRQRHWPDLLRTGRWLQLLREGLDPDFGESLPRRVRRILALSLGPLVSRQRRLASVGLSPGGGPVVPDYLRPEWTLRIGLLERLWSVETDDFLPSLAQQALFGPLDTHAFEIHRANTLLWAARSGIELRHPFYDRRLVEFVMGLPGHLLQRGKTRKWLLREALKSTLPRTIYDRETKAHFNDVITNALKVRYTRDEVLRLPCVERGWVDGERVWELFSRSISRPNDAEASSAPLWFTVSVSLWLSNAVAG